MKTSPLQRLLTFPSNYVDGSPPHEPVRHIRVALKIAKELAGARVSGCCEWEVYIGWPWYNLLPWTSASEQVDIEILWGSRMFSVQAFQWDR